MAALPTDLCLLADLKSWLNVTDTNSDTILQSAISGYSSAVGAYLSRTLGFNYYAENRRGTNQRTLFLKNRPVVLVSSVVIDTVSIQAAPDSLSAGYAYDDRSVYLQGSPSTLTSAQRLVTYPIPMTFSRSNIPNCAIGYAAGFLLAGQTLVDWASATLYPRLSTLVPTSNNAGGYLYVASSGGTSGGSRPAVFNQTPGGSTADGSSGLFWLNTGVIPGGATPMPQAVDSGLSQVVMEWIAQRYKSRTHIDQVSTNLNGMVSGWERGAPPPYVRAILDQYKNVVPVAP